MRKVGGRGFKSSALQAEVLRQQQENREAQLASLKAEYKVSKAAAQAAWEAGNFDECLSHLNECIRANAHSDALYRFRAKLHLREGRFLPALADANKALELNPASQANYLLEARCMQQLHKLSDAGAVYLQGLGGSAPDDAAGVNGYLHLLHSVRREREYFMYAEGRSSELWQKHEARAWLASRPNVFDPRKVFEDDGFAAKRPGAPPLSAGEVTTTSLQVCWETPDCGGDAVHKYVLQMATYDVKWDDKKKEVFDGYRDFAKVFEGKMWTRDATITGLQSDNSYKFRVAAVNSIGASEWSEELEMSTSPEQKADKEPQEEPLPAPWMRIDVTELLAEDEREGRQPLDFYRALAAALKPHVNIIRRIFARYSSAPKGGDPSITALQFARFVKDLGLVEGAASSGRPGKKIGVAVADLLFQRANLRSMNVSGRRSTAATLIARHQALETAIDELRDELDFTEDEELEDDDGDFSKSDGLMDQNEFVVALVRLAWQCFPDGARSSGKSKPLAERLSAFFSLSFLPVAQKMLERVDNFKDTLRSRRVQAVVNHYRPQLQKIYDVYAQADSSQPGDLDTVNLKEITFMIKEGNMFDSNLSVAKLVEIFSVVNQSSQADGEDDDETELDFEEFLQVLVRICDVKIPESTRSGGEFELTLQSWLHLIFIPTYMALLKDKKKGIGKTHI